MHESRIVPVFQALAEDIHALGVRAVFGLMSEGVHVGPIDSAGGGAARKVHVVGEPAAVLQRDRDRRAAA
jgi:hypothetical protein